MYPPGIVTRTCTVGGACAQESGDPLILSVVVASSRGLIWASTGWRLPSLPRTVASTVGSEATFELPVTSQAGYRSDGSPGTIIDVSVPGSYSHTYTATVTITTPGGGQVSRHIIGPFPLPAEDLSPVDLDTMLPVGTVAGGAVLVPDAWSARLAGQWDADDLAIARGFHEVLSATEPTATTYTAINGQVYPVAWIKPVELVVPVAPQEPVWNRSNQALTVPSLVGVEYRLTSVTVGATTTALNVLVPPGAPLDLNAATGKTVPYTVTVAAVAVLGYRLTTPASWSQVFPDPNTLTILASDDFATDRTLPFTLNNALGGTTTMQATLVASVASAPIPIGGVMRAPGTSTGFGAAQIALTDTTNLRVTFDLLSVGANTANATNGPVLRVSIFNWDIAVRVDMNGSDKRTLRLPGGHAIGGLSPTDTRLIGEWTVEVVNNVFTAVLPSGEIYSGDVTAMTKAANMLLVTELNNDTGTAIDNLIISRVGF